MRVLRRWRRLALLLVVVACIGWDWSRAPSAQLSARALIGAIHLYQRTLSPLMPGMGARCHFTPTCSHYAVGVVEKHGFLGGSWRAVWRVLRCGPWTPMGVVDPPE